MKVQLTLEVASLENFTEGSLEQRPLTATQLFECFVASHIADTVLEIEDPTGTVVGEVMFTDGTVELL
jgi:hypothetical protein